MCLAYTYSSNFREFKNLIVKEHRQFNAEILVMSLNIKVTHSIDVYVGRQSFRAKHLYLKVH